MFDFPNILTDFDPGCLWKTLRRGISPRWVDDPNETVNNTPKYEPSDGCVWSMHIVSCTQILWTIAGSWLVTENHWKWLFGCVFLTVTKRHESYHSNQFLRYCPEKNIKFCVEVHCVNGSDFTGVGFKTEFEWSAAKWSDSSPFLAVTGVLQLDWIGLDARKAVQHLELPDASGCCSAVLALHWWHCIVNHACGCHLGLNMGPAAPHASGSLPDLHRLKTTLEPPSKSWLKRIDRLAVKTC